MQTFPIQSTFRKVGVKYKGVKFNQDLIYPITIIDKWVYHRSNFIIISLFVEALLKYKQINGSIKKKAFKKIFFIYFNLI